MSWLASFALAILHALYWLVVTVKSACRGECSPQPLDAPRRQTPLHLALNLVVQDNIDDIEAMEAVMIESVDRAATWCRVVGINRLTIYDRQGVLTKCSSDVQSRLSRRFGIPPKEVASESDIEYPLTPPPSDDSDSRPLSPDTKDWHKELNVITLRFAVGVSTERKKPSKAAVRRRRLSRRETLPPSLTLHIISRQSGKPVISCLASGILRRRAHNSSYSVIDDDTMEQPSASVEGELSQSLEGLDGFPPPDLMLVHHLSCPENNPPLELYGFPPWQTRLTELYRDRRTNGVNRWRRPLSNQSNSAGQPLEEVQFRRALDQFAAAEMRLGK
ncbi:uncharacterized protein FIBRA_01042 [Fibroporia radiculosa]|uniref:ditrans,polycis-polyprenyl diphosphate synthase [(2E,6E)-farnesyldiphosphate specific] n=1 Tax=Fibroporia radiculosa TaxID=599839 RepID=J4G0R7_9APHY|nr:uncharacterized protein FIBRA_01042 [Fibroporia radiculosa]CCL99033.1 predicted protein [Fibroporia radiculosa]